MKNSKESSELYARWNKVKGERFFQLLRTAFEGNVFKSQGTAFKGNVSVNFR